MTTANAINQSSQGITYYSSGGLFTGIDGSTSGKVLTSNGTGTAPSFQTVTTSTTNTLQTTDATVTTISSLALGTNNAATMWGYIIGASSAYNNAVSGNFIAGARRAAANIIVISLPQLNVNTTASCTFTVNVDTVTNTIRVQVTGLVATTMNWICNFQSILETL